MVIVYNFKSFFDDNSSKKRTAQTYRFVLKYFRFKTDLQTPLDLKVRVDNHLKAIETEQSGTFSSKFSKYILLF